MNDTLANLVFALLFILATIVGAIGAFVLNRRMGELAEKFWLNVAQEQEQRKKIKEDAKWRNDDDNSHWSI